MEKKGMGLHSALAIGIGGMVGGGIFAVLGLTVELAKGGAAVAFLFAGIIAALTAYSYSKLSLKYPSEGGTVEFINIGFGYNWLSGSLNLLLWFSYIIMIALYAYAFGSYGSTFFPEEMRPTALTVLIAVSVLGPTLLNICSASIVGKSEIAIVALKVTILILVIFIGVYSMIGNKIDFTRHALSEWAEPFQLFVGGFLIFLAYEGFELIANSAEDMDDPKKNLPRAFMYSVIFVIIIYMLAGFVTVGVLEYSQIIKAKDYVLAEVAKSLIGNFGFQIVVVAALLSTFSAIAATLYSNHRLTREISASGQAPKFINKEIGGRPVVGLLLTGFLGFLLAVFGELEDISILGSVGFLTIFTAVNFINFKLRKETNSQAWIPLLGMLTSIIASIILLIHAYSVSPMRFYSVIFIFILSVGIEVSYLKISGRGMKFDKPA